MTAWQAVVEAGTGGMAALPPDQSSKKGDAWQCPSPLASVRMRAVTQARKYNQGQQMQSLKQRDRGMARMQSMKMQQSEYGVDTVEQQVSREEILHAEQNLGDGEDDRAILSCR